MYDMNDAELPRSSDLIPDGGFAKVTMTLRPGGADGQGELDRGLLKPTKTPGSDVLMLDAEFTVASGPHVRRKFWQNFSVTGGKVDEHGVSIAWKISKGVFRAMIDSALGLNPQDMSEAARGRRMLRGLADLDGITFAAKVKVEPSTDSRYADSNRLDRVVLPGEPEYQRIMDGETVPASPSHRSGKAGPAAVAAAAPPAWGSQPAFPTAAAPTAPVPAWQKQGAPTQSTAAAPPTQAATPGVGGPSWLNG